MEEKKMSEFFENNKNNITRMSIKKSFKDGILKEESIKDYIKKMQEKAHDTFEISGKLDITPYIYYSDLGQLNQEQNRLIEESKKNLEERFIGDSIEKDEKLDDINKEAYNFYQDSVGSYHDFKKMYEQYIHLQDVSVLLAMNKNALISIHATDANNLNEELQQIKSRTTIEKIKDLVTGQSRNKKERIIEIEKALDIIYKRIKLDIDERDNPGVPNKQITPEQVMINLYKAREILEKSQGKNSYGVERFEKMMEHIKERYNVDYKKVNELLMPERNQLPQITGKSAKITEHQKMDYFLKHQGYINETENSVRNNDRSTLQMDPFKLWNTGKIESIKRRVEKIKKVGTEIQIGEYNDDKKNEMRGTGIGFHPVL